MNASDLAGMYGIKAMLYCFYKPMGLREALDCAQTARDIDPLQAEWHYLVAYCLGKTRSEFDRIRDQELDEIEEACLLEKNNTTYIVRLGQVHADISSFLYRNRHDISVCDSPVEGLEKSIALGKSAVEHFKKALELDPLCPRLKAKVAHGLLQISDRSITDISLAKSLLDKAVNVLPRHSTVHLDLGKYYDKYVGELEKALECLKKAHELGNYSAFLYLVTLMWEHNTDGSILKYEISKALARYQSKEQQGELLVYLGTAYLLLEDDWTSAVKYFLKSLELEPSAIHMEKFRGFYWKNKSTNLLEVVTNELRIKTKQLFQASNSFHAFLGKIIAINQILFRSPLVPDMFVKFKSSQLRRKFKIQ